MSAMILVTDIYLLLIINIVFANSVTIDRVITLSEYSNHEVFGTLGFPNVESFAPVSDAVENELCRNHSMQLINGVTNHELWALKMLDATTKDPDGVLIGSLFQLGNYDECLSVQEVPSEVGAFSGRHCLVSLGPSSIFSEAEQRAKANSYIYWIKERLDEARGDVTGMISAMGATVAVCIPSSCTSRDLEQHLRREMRGTNISVRVDELACSSSADKVELQTNDWWAVGLVVCFGAIVACSTFIDVVCSTSGSWRDIFIAFSLYSNGRKLMKVAPPSADNMTPLNGIRVLTMLWVIAVHRVLLAIVTPSPNYSLASYGFDELSHILLTNGTVCIESFLLMSGLLVCYNFFKERGKAVKFNILRYYMHRYIRLTPPYAMMMLLSATLVNYLGDGPLWKSNMASSRDGCEKYWMFGLLYVNNYYPGEEMCMGRMGESWYLAVDMQLFLLSPIILYPLWRWPRVGKILLGITITAGLLIACAVPYIHRFPYSIMPGNGIAAYSQYFTTHTRFTSWLIGLCLGYALHMTKNRLLKLSLPVVIGGWIVGLLAMTTAVMSAYFFFQKDYVYNRLADSLYTGLNRPVFALGWAWIIFACVKGYGGKVNDFLSCSCMQILSRLIYSVYLTHLFVQRHFYASVRTPQFASNTLLMFDQISSVILCFAVALVLHLVVEAPILNIERIFTNRGSNSSQRQDIIRNKL